MKRLEFSKWIDSLEILLRSNQTKAVEREIFKYPSLEIPRQFLLPLTNLARRTGIPNQSLKWFAPLVKNEGSLGKKLTPSEVAEYAVCLSEVGLNRQAFQLLKDLETKDVPDAPLYSSFALFTFWEYEASIPYLESYLDQQITPYKSIVGKVNLAAALIGSFQLDEAQKLLENVRLVSKREGFGLLYGNSLELSAQAHIFQSNYSQALAQLEESLPYFKGSSSIYEFFVRKWNTICNAFIDPKSSKIAKIHELSQEAMSRGHWESVRDCEFFISVLTKDENLFHKVYFGTPFEAFRMRMTKSIWKPSLIHKRFIWPANNINSNSHIFDVDECKWNYPSSGLKKGMLLNRLIGIFASDLYKPFSIGNLFALLFPNSYYDPFTSPSRVHQLIHRLKKSIAHEGTDLAIIEDSRQYSLKLGPNAGIQMRLTDAPQDLFEARWSTFVKSISNKTFTAKGLQEKMNMTYGTSSRFLSKALSEGRIIRSGRGRSTKYCLNLNHGVKAKNHSKAS